jgi:vacuolar-type H+-ATPase subunit F/Vma7
VTFFVLGDADDVAGFALAGIEGAVCNTRGEIAEALRQLRRRPEVPSLLLVSPSVALLAGRALEDFFHPDRPPHALILPEAPPSTGRAGSGAP